MRNSATRLPRRCANTLSRMSLIRTMILSIDAFQPALVTTIEVCQSIDGEEPLRQMQRARLHLPLEHPDAPSLLSQR